MLSTSKVIDMYLCSIVVDSLLIYQITLIANQELVNTFSGVSVDFLQPLLDIAEGFRVRDIVDNNNAVSTSVVRRSDSTETLLTSSIPLITIEHTTVIKLRYHSFTNAQSTTYDLQLHSLSFQLDSADFLSGEMMEISIGLNSFESCKKLR
jgi:hypothetical protein